MITLEATTEFLQVNVSGSFDFEMSRQMLLKCKTYAQQHKIDKINVRLKQITSCNSCAIGALILLAEKAPGGFDIHLEQCSEEVHQLFESGFLDHFFNPKRTDSGHKDIPCANCYDSGCKTPVPGCDKASFLIERVYPSAAPIFA